MVLINIMLNRFYSMLSKNRAFSLIELLAVIILIAIVSLVAVPSLHGVISRNRAAVYANELMMALRFARATAINLGEPVRFCSSKDHQSCSGAWEDGSIVMTTNGKVIRVLSPVFSRDKLSWNHYNDIVFLPEGLVNGQQGSFYYCPYNAPKNALAIILNATGRVLISPKTHDNKEIPCNF